MWLYAKKIILNYGRHLTLFLKYVIIGVELLFPNFSELFPNYFGEIFTNSKRPDISKKFPIFENRTIPKLAKAKSLENSV